MSKDKKVVKYKKPFNLNIGVVIFVIIFIYLIFNVFSYMTTTHISVYEVEQGTMAENNVYNGLILRSEQIYNSEYSGALDFYVKELSKVSLGNLVYSVDENGDISQMIAEAGADASSLDSDNLDEIRESITDFQTTYDAQHYYNVYTFKDNLSATLEEVLNLNALNQLSDYAATAANSNTFHQVTAATPGVIAYYTDGYEGVTTESFTADMFNEANYVRNSSKNTAKINAGDAAYKLITSESWNIVLPISESLATELAEDDVMQIRFVKDDKKAYATYSITQKDGAYYAILTLKSAMVRYAKDRYVEVELILAEETGLKIPNSSITEKEFYTVPVEYFMKGGDGNDEGILVQSTDDKGASITVFIAPTIYYETDTHYYIDSEDVSVNDLILKADSSATYRIGTDTATLKGVYNINKGYAVFKQINILYQNAEYSIVETGTTYGIALYDHIALDGTKVKENELIK